MAKPFHDLRAIERYLRQAPFLHIYELGDLDPKHEPFTTWFAGLEGEVVDAVALLYGGLKVPTLVALANGPLEGYRRLLAAARSELPAGFYAHLSVGLSDALKETNRLSPLGLHLKMGLRRERPIQGIERVGSFSSVDAEELLAFYRKSYPASYFEPRALEGGPYVGIRDTRGIACAAGVHVFSRALRVAALGNIATRPDLRGTGLARIVTAALCRLLAPDVDHIGLNVRADNAAAISCYRKVGFESLAEYEEYRAEPA